MDLAKIRKKARASAPPSVPDVPVPPPAAPSAQRAAVSGPEPAPSPPPPPAQPAQECGPGPQDSPAAELLPLASAPAPPVAEAPAAAGRLEKVLVFAVGRRRYAIPIADISQIIKPQPETPVPHAPDFLRGIFSLRGRIVSVLDAPRRLGVPEEEGGGGAKVVVLDLGEELFGLRVHAIEQVVEVDLSALEPPPESFLPQEHEFVEGVFHHRDRTVSVLNLSLFLTFEVTGRPA